jgi:tetratricopeptide (TPR) repeat protein
VEVKGILAGIYSERGETAKADSLFKILEEDGVLTPDMSLMMIYDLISMNKVDEAAERAIKLLELNPEETRYRALLADIYYENGLKEKSDSIYAAIIEEDPDNIESQFLYLMNLVNRKEYTGISGFLRNIFRSEVVEREGKIAVARRMAGDSAYMKENAESMIESLLLLEEQYPDDEEVISLRPAVYEATDKIDLAIQRYEEIIKSIRQGFWFKERLMILYARKNEYSKLYELAGDYSRDNNRSLIGKIYYALAAMELGEYSVAGNELKKAMILAGNNNELKVQVLSLEGDLHYRKKDFDASYACYEEALKLSPDDPLLLNNYAYFLAEGDKDLKKALKMIMKVIETESGNATYVDTYAWVLYKMGKYRDAHREMVRVFELSSDRDPELLEHMGFIKKAVGRCEEAVVYWKEALKEDSKKAYLEEEIIKCQKQ